MQGTWRARVGVTCVAVGMLFVGLAMNGPSAHAAVQSLAGWMQEGAAGAGSWQVGPDGNSVTETAVGGPTFFVGTKPMNAGSFTVDITPSGADDDYVGIVVGYLQPSGDPSCNTSNCINNFVLIDWKRATEAGGANEGMSLMRVDGNFNNRSTNTADQLPCFWKHATVTGCDVLKTDFGVGKGWTPDVVNRLRVTYSLTHVKVEKLNTGNNAATTVIDQDGTFPLGGRFGFYNYSQANSIYSIADVVITDPAQAPTTTTTTSTPPTTVAGGATTITTARSTTTAAGSATTLRTTIVRTGNDSRTTTLELLAGVAFIALGAVFTAARGRRPQGTRYSG